MLLRLSINTGCRVLLKTNTITQKCTTNRFLHLACRRSNNALFTNRTTLDFNKYSGVTFLPIRHASTEEATPVKSLLSEIPEPPTAIPEPVAVLVEKIAKIHANGEPTFESLGLGRFTLPGLIENSLEWLHISCDLPWWAAICATTLCIRLLIFPLMVINQTNAAKLNNVMPEIQKVQQRMTQARQAGDETEAALQAYELQKIWKEKKVNPLKNFVVIAVQAPIFISYMMSLRDMAAIPVESLKHGGLWWFENLCVPDPYYILPLFTSASLYLTLRISADGGAGQRGLIKYVLRGLPIVLFPFIMNFEGAVLCYWSSTNFISLVQALILKNSFVRNALNLPQIIKHDPKKLPMEPKNFKEGLKDAWTNMSISRNLADRQRADAVQFHGAGTGPIVKTYKHDPTKQHAAGSK